MSITTLIMRRRWLVIATSDLRCKLIVQMTCCEPSSSSQQQQSAASLRTIHVYTSMSASPTDIKTSIQQHSLND